jgi:hydrogenase nickel incorporation protein HypB
MCETCGCGIVSEVRIDGVRIPRQPEESVHMHPHDHPHDHAHPHDPAHGQAHDHDHEHRHGHPHPHPEATHRTIDVQQAILEKNDRLAERNRGFFQAKGLFVLNILSSPGAGKTTFIERMAADLAGKRRLGVIVGDLATDNDATRLRAHGVPAVQITTGTVCHLDAEMIAQARARLDLDGLDLLIIENVGNLVCPAAYDLGEDLRVVLFSVTEGEDKPLKYPVMFRSAQVVVINKADIAEAVGFERAAALANIRRAAPGAMILELSARTGQGLEDWYRYLGALLAAKRGAPPLL